MLARVDVSHDISLGSDILHAFHSSARAVPLYTFPKPYHAFPSFRWPPCANHSVPTSFEWNTLLDDASNPPKIMCWEQLGIFSVIKEKITSEFLLGVEGVSSITKFGSTPSSSSSRFSITISSGMYLSECGVRSRKEKECHHLHLEPTSAA